MGAKIEEVDYDGIMRQANKIADRASNMQNYIKQAFQRMDQMRNNWFGDSYDNFIRGVNMSIPGLNNTFMNTVVTYPMEIAAKARSLASANQAHVSVGLPANTAIQLADITLTGKGSKLRFREDQVRDDQANIKTNFENAKSEVDKAINEANNLKSEWQSVSGDRNIQELVQSFNRVKNIIAGLQDSLDSCISAQALTVNALESAAQAVDTAGNIMEDAVDSAKDAVANTVNKIQETAADVWRNLTGGN